MSRSGYSDDLDNWALICWRGAVASALKGKRGQAFLKELEAALLALPEKKLVAHEFTEKGQVCALGAVALKRKLEAGKDRAVALMEIEKDAKEMDAPYIAEGLGVARAMGQEIMYINDEDYRHDTDEKRYENVLAWVRENLKSPK